MEVSGEIVAGLVSIGYSGRELEELAALFPGSQLGVVVDWLCFTYTMHSLVSEIGLGTGRIVELVKALKTYTFMDQAPVQSVDVREGLDNTLIILHNKLKSGVTVVREYADDVPVIEAYAGELNQVWTNIIDNAIDAMGGEGTLTVRTRPRGRMGGRRDRGRRSRHRPGATCRRSSIRSSRPRDPERARDWGWASAGTLIVQKHQGRMSVSSEPGRTCFSIRLPIDFRPSE